MVTEQDKLKEVEAIKTIINRVSRDWTPVKLQTIQSVIDVEVFKKSVQTLVWETLIKQNIIEATGKRSGIRYRRTITDSYIHDAAIEVQYAIRQMGWDQKSFASTPRVKPKVEERPTLVVKKTEITHEVVTTKYFGIGEEVYLIHKNEPTHARVKVAEAQFDELGNIVKATYEVAIAPGFKETIITNKLYPTRKALWDAFTKRIFGDENK